MQEKQRQSVWICPKCNKRQRQPSYIKEVMHRCKMNKNLMTYFKKQD